jgi:magnesium transporter
MKLNSSSTNIVRRLLTGRPSRPLRSLLKRIESVDLASLITQLHSTERKTLIENLISIKKVGSVLTQIPENQLREVLASVDTHTYSQIIQSSAINDNAFLLNHTDEEKREALLSELPFSQKERLLQFLNFPEDSAGRMMTSHFFSVPSHISAQEGLDLLRQRAQEESLYYIYCTNEEHKLVGVVSLRVLVTAPPATPIEKLAKKDVVTVKTETPSEQVAQIVSHYDFIAVPVVNNKEEMVGIVTVDDVVDLIQEQALAKIYARAGLQEDDRVYSNVFEKVRNRVPWMMLNLGLSAVASIVVSRFEDILQELVILAVTKNIVASTSGNTAIQCLTVVTRGIATNDFQFISYAKAFWREFIVGSIIGSIMGLFSGLFLYFFMWNDARSVLVGSVMFISMLLTSVVGAAAGAGVPFLLKKLNRDPAVGSGVLVTVITDIFGFFSFLGLATLAMKLFASS